VRWRIFFAKAERVDTRPARARVSRGHVREFGAVRREKPVTTSQTARARVCSVSEMHFTTDCRSPTGVIEGACRYLVRGTA